MDAQGVAKHFEYQLGTKHKRGRQIPKVTNGAVGIILDQADKILPASTEKKNRTQVSIQQQRTRYLQKFILKQLQERKEAGLCFKCDENFVPGHKCQKLCWIDVVDDEQQSDNDINDEVEERDRRDNMIPAISLNALTGVSTLNIMRIIGRIGGNR